MGLNIDIKNFYNDNLPATSTILYTVPPGYKAVIKSMLLRSMEILDKDISLSILRSGKTVVVSPVTLKALHTWVHDSVETLEPGDYVVGNTEAGATIGCRINGVLEKI